jgi:hypothetical protein
MPCEGLSVIPVRQRLRRQIIANQIAASAPPLGARLHTLIGRPIGAFIILPTSRVSP